MFGVARCVDIPCTVIRVVYQVVCIVGSDGNYRGGDVIVHIIRGVVCMCDVYDSTVGICVDDDDVARMVGVDVACCIYVVVVLVVLLLLLLL